MMMLSVFSSLPIGRIPAYQIAKAQKTHRYQGVTLIAILECESWLGHKEN
jgi:hypothetical protein